jgi:glycosyltransferase involved in cell wall biosynthesis
MQISIIIPSRNNLEYVKQAYYSIRNNIKEQHEIILLDDASTDGTWEWMRSIKNSDSNVQIYKNTNADRVGHTVLYDIGVKLASNNIFGIFHADMVASPNYINNILKHLERGMVISSTRIEPPLHPPSPEKIVFNLGLEPEEFIYSSFNEYVDTKEKENKDILVDGIFAPWIMYKDDFIAIGGHDALFAPMELEDSDIFYRMQLAGYKLKQSRDSLVYHMTCRGSRFKDGLEIEKIIDLPDGTKWYKPKDSEEYINLRQNKFREWWRKWHQDVLHDENILPVINPRYNITYIAYNCNYEFLKYFEPWCDEIYITNSEVKANYLSVEQPNSLLKLKNKIKILDKIEIKHIKMNSNIINNKDIVIQFDCLKLNNDVAMLITKYLSKWITDNIDSVGTYDAEFFQIHLNNKKNYLSNMILPTIKNVF